MIYNLVPVNIYSQFLSEILNLISKYHRLLFSSIENPIKTFIKDLKEGKIKVIAATENNNCFAFIAFYNFQEIASHKFRCYMYGAADRKSSKKIAIVFSHILDSLKKQGCISLRFETYYYNLPMRFFARRFGFRKVGVLKNATYLNGQFVDNILYEKIFE